MGTLYYLYDPMCSWCWAFRTTLQRLQQALPAAIEVVPLLGGLAPDNSETMPEAQQRQIQSGWRRIEETVPGIHFNFEFWSRCRPQRSTYAACRAVIAARPYGKEWAMVEAIQYAYYRQARNPSERGVLITLAGEIGLDVGRFAQALASEETEAILRAERHKTTALGVDSFPSLVLETGNSRWPLGIDYNDPQPMLETIEQLLA